MTHRELCFYGAKYLKSQGITPFNKCKYVVVELERIGECPDCFGIDGYNTQLIEVKISRSDFLSDKKKHWRIHPEFGLGMFRSYLCPQGMITPNELPLNWGLLYIDDKNKITKIVEPKIQQSNHQHEIALMSSILRREGIKPQIFSYKNCKEDLELNFNFNGND